MFNLPGNQDQGGSVSAKEKRALMMMVLLAFTILIWAGAHFFDPGQTEPEHTPQADQVVALSEDGEAEETATDAEPVEEIELVPPTEEVPQPVEYLDTDILYSVYDITSTRNIDFEAARGILKEQKAFAHLFSYLRSHSLEELLSPLYTHTDKPGALPQESLILEVLGDDYRTAEEISQALSLDLEATREHLSNMLRAELIVSPPKRFLQAEGRELPANASRGEELIYQALHTDTPQTLDDLTDAVQGVIARQPAWYTPGNSRGTPRDETWARVLAEVRRHQEKARDELTAAGLAEALGMEVEATQDALEQLRNRSYVEEKRPAQLSATDVEIYLQKLLEDGTAEMLPQRFGRAADPVPVPDHLADCYRTIRGSISSKRYLVNELEAEPEDIEAKLQELLSLDLIKEAPQPQYGDFVQNPEKHRGTFGTFDCVFRGLHKVFEWRDEVRETSGVKHTRMFFATEREYRQQFYVVLALEPIPEEIKTAKRPHVRIQGMFVKLYPVENEGEDWRRFPLLIARNIEIIQPPETDDSILVWIIAGIAIVVGVVVFIGARKDAAKAREHRQYVMEKQRKQRDEIRRRRAEADGGSGAEQTDADTAKDDAEADAGDADAPEQTDAKADDESDTAAGDDAEAQSDDQADDDDNS